VTGIRAQRRRWSRQTLQQCTITLFRPMCKKAAKMLSARLVLAHPERGDFQTHKAEIASIEPAPVDSAYEAVIFPGSRSNRSYRPGYNP
jgi:hypothetical protein